MHNFYYVALCDWPFLYKGLLLQSITTAGMTVSVLLPKTDSKYDWDAKEKIDVLK